ncbi:MAG: hydrolase 2, exosortase A system-associated [Azoarcus sp.]|nr:hydrolase 2, exosortase A system-associated [Azoarcus sp.]
MAPDFARAVFFLETPRGRRFCVASIPAEPPLGTVLYFPPFAGEMNESRRMAALTARALASRGWLVLQPDLGGCGDSEGDFGCAAWHGWIEDMDAAWNWLIGRAPEGRRVLWTLRAGSLLADGWLYATGHRPDLLLWQPVLDGEQYLQQFLRPEPARRASAETSVCPAIAWMRERLDGGVAVEVAGYAPSLSLAQNLAVARFSLPEGYGGRVDMIETGLWAGAPSSPLAALRETLAASGVRATACKVAGPAFWQAQAAGEAPALLEKTLAVLDGARS